MGDVTRYRLLVSEKEAEILEERSKRQAAETKLGKHLQAAAATNSQLASHCSKLRGENDLLRNENVNLRHFHISIIASSRAKAAEHAEEVRRLKAANHALKGEAITLRGRLMEAELLLGRLGSACRALKELQAEDARVVEESREPFEVLPDSSAGGRTSLGSGGGRSMEGLPAKAGLQPRQLEGLLAASKARAAAAPGQGKQPCPQSPAMTVIKSGQESEAPDSDDESVEQKVSGEDSSAPSGETGQACGADGQLVQLSAVCDTEEEEQEQQPPSDDGLEQNQQTPPPADASRSAAASACPTTRTRPRPKMSYTLPSLNAKLRQGDSGTFGLAEVNTKQSSKESARKAP